MRVDAWMELDVGIFVRPSAAVVFFSEWLLFSSLNTCCFLLFYLFIFQILFQGHHVVYYSILLCVCLILAYMRFVMEYTCCVYEHLSWLTSY